MKVQFLIAPNGSVQSSNGAGFNSEVASCVAGVIKSISFPAPKNGGKVTIAIWQSLLEGGLYVNMARPPATPAGTFLLRCSLCAEHRAEQVDEILELFAQAGRATGVIG